MKKIPLTRGKYALVDDADFEWLNQWKWCAQKSRHTYYAVRVKSKGLKQIQIFMHKLILNPPDGLKTDHINHSGLDNRRQNLRVCTLAENQWNQRLRKEMGEYKSEYKGVSWNKGQKYKGGRYKGGWRARIGIDKKQMYLGYFQSEIDAAKAYDKKAKELFGEFAETNF